MPEYLIAGIPVNFPFEPYDVQKAYMEKVIKCLENSSNGILESPTGTGKTLSLLCSSLAWLLSRKATVQSQLQKGATTSSSPEEEFARMNAAGNSNWGVPKIIYASRTHSQLTQAMQELKRTAYSFMRAVVLGSRDQLCIHPDVMREQGNSNKIQMCKVRVDTRTCTFHSRVESKKDHPDFRGPTVVDIEDLVAIGQKLKMCPYYASKELVGDADITFMPYNYLLDPKARKANKVDLHNTIVILDEAHNIEKMCEESASVQLKSSDVAMAIDDVTHIMKAYSDGDASETGDEPKDFTMDDLALLKEMLLDLEKVIDDIIVENKSEGATFPPPYLFELLEKANFSKSTAGTVVNVLEKLLQYLTVQTQHSSLRKGGSFQILGDFLSAVFFHKEDSLVKIHKSFKVHVEVEEVKQQNTRGGQNKDVWLSKASTTTTTTKMAKIINYWCFNPGFGMESLLNKNIRSIILTSGTLAPLTPLIAELALPVAEKLENPHIVSKSQVYVKIVGFGPDREQLISNYANRDNPKYISSLGQTILNVARIVPDGLLVFFPSYPLMNQCVNSWQASGLWHNISQYKPIYVEPRGKESFTTTMDEFYQSIRDSKGACFMAVCRGKVSEGLDFADRNGRAVIITGLPFPPLKDPKVILKKRYLNDNRTKANELLSGQEWYGLEATRAVNQAIGRVIRHKNDYGAILLCDCRFQQPSQVQQLSKWIREHLGDNVKSSPFGPVVRELREFFKNAEKSMPKPQERSIETVAGTASDENMVKSEFFSKPKEVLESKNRVRLAQVINSKVEKTNSVAGWSPEDYASAAGRQRGNKEPTAVDFISRLDTDVSVIDFNGTSSSSSCSNGLVNIHKRERGSPTAKLGTSSSDGADVIRKKRFKLVGSTSFETSQSLCSSYSQVADKKQAPEDRIEFLRELRSVLSPEGFSEFTTGLVSYKKDDTIDALIRILLRLLGQQHLTYLLLGMRRFLKPEHKQLFDEKVVHIL